MGVHRIYSEETPHAILHALAAVGESPGKQVSEHESFIRHYVPVDGMGSKLPTVSRPLDESHEENRPTGVRHDNDIDPDFWESSALQVGSFNSTPGEVTDASWDTLTTPFASRWDGSIPLCSPFLFPQLVLAHLFWLIGYASRGSIFAGRRSFLTLLTALSVLPLCCHRSDNLLRDRILRSRISFYPFGARTLRKLGFTPMGPLVRNPSVLSSVLSCYPGHGLVYPDQMGNYLSELTNPPALGIKFVELVKPITLDPYFNSPPLTWSPLGSIKTSWLSLTLSLRSPCIRKRVSPKPSSKPFPVRSKNLAATLSLVVFVTLEKVEPDNPVWSEGNPGEH